MSSLIRVALVDEAKKILEEKPCLTTGSVKAEGLADRLNGKGISCTNSDMGPLLTDLVKSGNLEIRIGGPDGKQITVENYFLFKIVPFVPC
ncbi:MAG: hypothetical protein Q7K28_01015 [Candidatus Wildermuthbacteria bacterium]|nr:hypothetical protein [Candidatus Wildermuthbacteria bacterium]